MSDTVKRHSAQETTTVPHHRIERRDERMLTPQEAQFVANYLATGGDKKTLTDCAKRAGFASATGLLKRPAIRKEIGERMGKVMAKKMITAERVIEELGKIAFANIDDFVDDDYRVLQKPGRRKMAAVQEVTTETIKGRTDEDEDVKRVKVKMYDKKAALDSLGRHFGLFTDKVEVSGDLGERLDRAFKRLEAEGAEPAPKDEGNDE